MLLAAVRALDPADPRPCALLSRAGAVAQDPKLDEGHRKRLDTAVEGARERARDPHIGAAAKKVLDLNVHRHDVEQPLRVRRYGELLEGWTNICARAGDRRVSRFDMAGSAGIVEDMRRLAASPHLTQKQKKTFRDIAAERDDHLARQRRQETALSQRLGGGRSI